MAKNPYSGMSPSQYEAMRRDIDRQMMQGDISIEDGKVMLANLDAAQAQSGNASQKKEATKRAKESAKVHTEVTQSNAFTPEEKNVSAQVAEISNQTVRNSVDDVFSTPTQTSTPGIAGTIPGATVKNESSVLFQNPVRNITKLGESLGAEKAKPTKTGYEGLDYQTLRKLYGTTFEDEREGYITKEEGKERRDLIDMYSAQVATGDDLVKFIAEKTAQRDENRATNAYILGLGAGDEGYGPNVNAAELSKLATSARNQGDFYSDIVAIAKDKQTRDNAQKKKDDSYYSYGSYAVENGATDTKYYPTDMGVEMYDTVNRYINKGMTDDIYGFMTAEELNLYNALYNSGDKEKSDEFLESIEGNLQIRMSDFQTKRAREYGEKHPYIAGAGSVVRNVVGGIPAAVDNIGEFLFKGEVDTYDSTSRFMRESQAAIQGGSEYMRSHYGETGEFFYNTGVSMAEFGLNLLIGKGLGSLASGLGASANTASNIASKAMTINMGANAASNAMTDIADRGGESWQVVTGGIAAGLAEYVFEKVSIDNLFNSKTAGTVAKDFKGYAMNAFKNIPRVAGQAITEGSEELFTSAANLVTDAIIMMGKSESALKRQAYLKQGMTIEEASRQVFIDTVKQLALDTAGGMLSGSIIGGANLAMQDISHTRYMESVGERMLKNPDSMMGIVSAGVENKNPEAVDFQNKVKNGYTVTGKDAGRVIESVLQDVVRQDGGIINISNAIEALEGNSPSFRNKQELFDTAKAVVHLATGNASEVDEALITKSKGAMTLLSAIEGDSKSINSIKDAAAVQLRDASQMQNSEGKVQSEILRSAQNDGGVMQNAKYGVRSEGINTPSDANTPSGVKFRASEGVRLRDADIYSHGQRVSVPQNAKMSDGIVITEASEKFRKNNHDGYKMSQTLAKDLNMPIIYVDDLTDAKGNTLDGIKTSEGIFINVNAKDVSRLAVTHEFSHRMKDIAPKAWAKYQNYVIEREKVNGRYYDAYELKKGAYGNDTTVIDEEIAADYIGDMFADQSKLQEFIEANRSESITVRDVYYGILDRLGLLDEKKKAQLLWRKAYREAMQNRDKKSEGVRYKTAESIEKAAEESGISVEKTIKTYPYDMQKVIKEYIISVDEKFEEFIESVLNDENISQNEKYYFGNINDRAAKDIERITGINVEGFKVAIEARMISHINKDHGPNGASNSSMANKEDIARMEYILNHYDDISSAGRSKAYTTVDNSGKSRTADTVIYSKKINGTYYLVQAVPDTKAKTLFIVTAYINKKGASQLTDADKAPVFTPENGSVKTPSIDNNVSQETKVVNRYSMQNEEKKQKQFEIIQKNNPAPNSYSTWVRSVEDVRTYKEAWEYDEVFTPDYTEEMAQAALEKGSVKVYSSYPIKQGVFVTPSEMEAQGYAGNGKVYSKIVNLEDVAWLSSLEGQYAKVGGSTEAKKSISGTRLSEYEGGELPFRPSTETGWLSQQWIAERSADNQAVAKPLTEISRIVTEELNVPVTRRKFTDEGVSGSYNLTSEAIHTRAANDIVTLSHEVGHHLDKVLNMQELDGFDKVVDNFSKTLVALGYEENAKKTEAVGEFIRMYLTNKDVAKNFAPEYYEAFETALKEKGYDKSIGRLADAVNAYLSSSVSERLDLAISETDGRGKLQKLKEDGIKKELEEKKTMFTELFDNINQNFIDSFYAIGKAQTRLYVDTKDGKQDAHLLATNSLNSAARSAYILTKKMTNVDGEEIGMSFIDSISPIYDKNPKQKKKNISNLNRYLVLKHALEWIAPTSENVKKKRVFSDERLENPEVLRQEIAKIEAELPAVKQAAENIYQYLRNLKKYWGVDTGLMTSELSKQLDEMYPNYVPFYRQSDKRGSRGARVNLANQRAPILEASGGSDMIVNPLESIINLTEKYVKTSSRNMAMQALAYMADNIEGSGFIIERVSEAKQQELVGGDKLYQNESNQAFATPDELKKITTEEDVWKKEFINGIGYVSVLIDGEKVWYQINDKRLFNAVADMTPQQLSLISRVLAPFMQLKRALITSNNPLFATTNAVRDAINAYHNSDINNPIEYLGAYFTAFKHVLQRDPNYERWCAMGGGHSSEISANMNSVNRALGKAMRTSTVNKVMYSILHPIEFVASINDVVESVPRLMAFEDEMKRTGDVHRAINKADDITTNFKRGGRKAKNYNNIFIFSNAQIQGLDRTRRSFTQSDVENGIRNRVIMYAVEAVLIAALQAWWNRRDEETEEDYKNLSKYMKRSQYVISIGGGKFLRFPTAREQDLLRVIITDAIDMAFGDKESFDGLLGFVADAFIPPYIEFPTNTKGKTMTDKITEMAANTFRNTPIGTFTDLLANKNFTGTDVIPEYLQDELPENQYNEKTSKLAVFLGKIFKDSPMKIDYIINNNLGILGTLNKSLFPMDSSQVDKSLGFKSRWVADSYYSTDVLNEVYDMRDAAEINMKRDKNGENVAEYEKINAVTTFISQYNNSIKGLPDPEKRAARKELLTIINTWGNEPSAVNGELIRLYNSTGENLFMQMPKLQVYTESGKRNMTPEEYVDCVTKYTAGFEAAVSEVMSSKEYKNADNSKKVDMIEDASKYALSAAKADTIPDAQMTKWEQRIVEGRDNLSEVASERADSEKRKDFKADWKKENFEYDSSKYTDEELRKIEEVETSAAGYYEAKANGGDVNNNDYRHIRVYESQLEDEMPIEEYAEVRAKAKTEGARLDPNGSDTNLGQRELYDYLETTDYPRPVKEALFEAIGSKNWTNLYNGKKIQ